ncbi:HTH domain-containing protein [Marivirga sp.]|uniref:HTH domain-containing protein n=1 Tax=Marivirga sp. TaxID=2018662 RepID=UPI003DA76FCB
MSGLKYVERFMFVNELINKERTGNPSALATKLNVSERTIYRIIDDLRLYYGYNPEILFDNEKNSYVFVKKNM